MKPGCNTLPQAYSELGWPKTKFKPDDNQPGRKVAYWHVANSTDDMELVHQIVTIYEAFGEINYHLSKMNKVLMPAARREDADIVITFNTNNDDLPVKFMDGVLAYALPNRIYVNDRFYWTASGDIGKRKDLKYTLIHECLHVLGLGHTQSHSDIMAPKYAPSNRITQDTINGLWNRYGESLIQRLSDRPTPKKINWILIGVIVLLSGALIYLLLLNSIL